MVLNCEIHMILTKSGPELNTERIGRFANTCFVPYGEASLFATSSTGHPSVAQKILIFIIKYHASISTHPDIKLYKKT